MRIGARNLLDKYHGNQREVAEAFVRGDLTRIEEPFIWDVICDDDVEAARGRLERRAWRLVDRVVELETEVAKLKQQVAKLRGNK